jgi:succinate dehydrogenase/fumarate reductase flavoprotein subunit
VRREIPGGTGLTNGSVFGRIAGANAAKAAKSESHSKRVART